MLTPAHLRLPPDRESARHIGPWLTEILGELPEEEALRIFSRLELAVHEICINIVDHASPPAGSMVEITGHIEPDQVRVELSDRGVAFAADEVIPPIDGVPQERGYGLFIVRKLVDELGYRRDNDTNRWWLRVFRSRQEGS